MLEQLGKRRIVGHDRDRPAPVGDAGADHLVVADVADDQDDRRFDSRQHRSTLVEPSRVDEAPPPRPGCRRGQAHQLDEVAGVVAVGRAGPGGGRAGLSGRQAQDVPEVLVRPAPLRRPEQVRGPGEPADHGPGRPGRQPAERATSRHGRAGRSVARRSAGLRPRRRCAEPPGGSARRLRRRLATARSSVIACLAGGRRRPWPWIAGHPPVRLLDRRLGARPASRCPRRG